MISKRFITGPGRFQAPVHRHLRRLSMSQPILTPDDLNPAVLNVEYAVRGELAIKSEEFREALKDPKIASTLPFNKVVSSNIGNPQQKGLDQPPVTFLRQVAALTEYPELMKTAKDAFPPDVIERARELLDEIGSIGAYSHSQGVPFIRKNVAKFIEDRDGYPSNPNHIFLTSGATPGVALFIQMLIKPVTPNNPDPSGILIPLPQYPLYSATLAAYSGTVLPYYTDESKGWSTSPDEVRAALAHAKERGVIPKALVVINPGNPTGALLDEETQEELVKVCEEHRLVLMADEVYQFNLHRREEGTFTSFKKIVRRMNSQIPVVSYHSVSKGVLGECGKRGGYFELTNFSEELIALVYKMISIGLCSAVSGQIAVDSMVRPPKPGSPSYDLWKKETDTTHAALASRTHTMATRLNALPGVSCVDSLAAMYLFPSLHLPQKAVEEAEKQGRKPDALYAMELLKETGICVVPGSGFGQRPGTNHYRLTVLCPGVEEYVSALERFHLSFMEKYS